MYRALPDAVEVTLDSSVTWGLIHETDIPANEGEQSLPRMDFREGAIQLGKRRSVAIATGALSGLSVGSTVSVRRPEETSGTSYTVREMAQVEDGAATEIVLSR